MSGAAPRIELVLYVGDCEESERTIETMIDVLGAFEARDVSLAVRNVASTPATLLESDRVATVPTLIMRRPLHLRFVGRLRSQHLLRMLLGVSQVPVRSRAPASHRGVVASRTRRT